MKIRPLMLTLLLGLLTVQAEAAVIYLKDGSQIVGTVVSATARDVQIYTSNGTMTVSTDSIQHIDYSNAQPYPEQPQTAPAPSPVPQEVPVYRRRRWVRREEPVDIEEAHQVFSLGLGIADPLSQMNFSSVNGGNIANGNAGFMISPQYLYYVNPQLALGGEFDYFYRGTTNSPNGVPNNDTQVNGDSEVFLGLLKFSLVDHGQVRPFILGGAGVHHTTTDVYATPVFGPFVGATSQLVDYNTWGFAGAARAGIDFQFLEPWMFTFEVGWMGLEGGNYTVTPAGRALGLSGGSSSLNVFTVAGRWGWRF